MIKFKHLLLALLFVPITALAQFTAVTATITDSDSQTWNNGTWTATLINSNPQVPPSINGTNLTTAQMNLAGTMSGSGVITQSMASNAVVQPLGTYWQFTICPNASVQCSTATASVSGSSQNISTTLSSKLSLLRFPASAISYGYSDAEVSPKPNPGGIYFNVTSLVQRVWTGAVWVNNSGGSNFITSLTTIGTSGAAAVNLGNLNIPNYATSGGSLPTATYAGQILSSTAAGNTYAVQGQVFYQQSGDTIASIESACASLCTYIVTGPQTITLAANHTLSSNVQVSFLAGGLWTVNGSFTLTIPGGVTGTLTQHFTGSSTVVFGAAQTFDYAEWFGAVADWNGTTGTNNTVPIQNALNAMSVAVGYGVTLLQSDASYMISAAINIPDRGGLFAANANTVDFSFNQAIIVQTSASADIIRMVGSSGSYISTQLGNLSLRRSIVPTGTATAVYSEYDNAVMTTVSAGDSIRDFYLHGSRSILTRCYSSWGFQGLSEPAGNYYGIYLNDTDSAASDGLTIRDHTVNSDPAGTAGTYYGFYATGIAISDLHIENFGTNGGNYPIQIIYTGTGGEGTAYDIHIINSVLDHFANTGILISGLPFTGADSSVEISGGAIASTSSNSYCVHITNSAGVSVKGVTDITCQMNTDSNVLVDNSSNIIIQGNGFGNLGPLTARGISLNNTVASSVVGNTFVGDGSSEAAILINGTSNGNSITGNSMTGPLGWGIYADTATANNTGFETNSFTGSITTPIFDGGNNPLTALKITTGTHKDMIFSGYGSGGYNQISFNGQSTDGLRLGIIGGSSLSGDPNLYLGTPHLGDFYFLTDNPQVTVARLTTSGLFIPTIGVKPGVYTVGTLPSAATLGAGATVVISDATTFTPGTCTGGGSDYMLAVSNGSTWSCH